MNCESIIKILEGYYNATLSKQEMAQISKHLGNCEGCKKNLASMAYERDHYSLSKNTLDRLIDDFIELNSKWEL